MQSNFLPDNSSGKAKSDSFWSTLPGILTGLAALLTAIGGLYAVLNANQPKHTVEVIPTVDTVPRPVDTIRPVKIRPKVTPGGSSIMPPRSVEQSVPITGFRVEEVTLRADPFDFTGTCPQTIVFSGRISMVGGRGTVSYRFLRSDGASAPVESVTFDGPGSKEVSTSWQLGGTYSGWQQLKIIDPQEKLSERAAFSLKCQ